MRLIKSNIERDGSGSITLFPEEPEDMWHAYNLIAPTDLLRASAIRRITSESSTGSTSSSRVHITLLIRVTSLDFDAPASQLHVSGRVAAENPHAKVGAHHTLDLALHRDFSLEKPLAGWDSVALAAVRDALRPDPAAVVPAVVMHDGLANIALVSDHRSLLRQRLHCPVPRKRPGAAPERDKGLARFYQLLLDALLRHVDLTLPRPVLLASPGFTAQGFLKYVLDEAARTGNKALLANKANFVVVHASSGHLHSLNEVLKSPEVVAKLKDTKYAKETKLMDEFMALLRKDDGRAWYGPSEVEKAVEKGAVGRGGGVLLISNSLFRSQVIGTRKRWVALVDKVKEEGGDARIFSSDHESGKRLEGLGGIAAILTFPLEDLDGEDDEDNPAPDQPESVQI